MKKRYLSVLLIFLMFFVSSCSVDRCSDETEYDACSIDKPLYCLNGTLVSKSSVCGCPPEFFPNDKERCSSIYLRNPKNTTLEYTLRGNKESFDWEVYGGLNHYVAGIERRITYYEGEPEPKFEDFIFKNINDKKQKDFIKDFVDQINSLSDNEEDRVRRAVSVIQNIPYGDLEENKERYAYQVLYDNKGICGEKSELLAMILKEMDYGVALITYGDTEPSFIALNSPFSFNHQAVGIKCPMQYSYDNTGYCFIETSPVVIITDSEGDYPMPSLAVCATSNPECIQKLPDEYTLTIISDGNSCDGVSEEFEDAKEWNRIMNLGEVLNPSDYSKWEGLVAKYGMEIEGARLSPIYPTS